MEVQQDAASGKFVKGNTLGKGRPKGSRNKLTEKMLQRFAERNEDGISVEEILFDIAQNKTEATETRMKAASKLADMVFPKAQSVELEVVENEGLTLAEMDEKIKQLMNSGSKAEE